jgi:hypothetical protein
MSALASAGGADDVSWSRLRMLVGHRVAVDTDSEHVEGTLLSCTTRSAWIVSGDEDHVVALPHLRVVHDLS